MPAKRIILFTLALTAVGGVLFGYNSTTKARQAAAVDDRYVTIAYSVADFDETLALNGVGTSVAPSLLQRLLGIGVVDRDAARGPRILMGGGLDWLFRRAPKERRDDSDGRPFDFTIRG